MRPWCLSSSLVGGDEFSHSKLFLFVFKPFFFFKYSKVFFYQWLWGGDRVLLCFGSNLIIFPSLNTSHGISHVGGVRWVYWCGGRVCDHSPTGTKPYLHQASRGNNSVGLLHPPSISCMTIRCAWQDQGHFAGPIVGIQYGLIRFGRGLQQDVVLRDPRPLTRRGK